MESAKDRLRKVPDDELEKMHEEVQEFVGSRAWYWVHDLAEAHGLTAYFDQAMNFLDGIRDELHERNLLISDNED